MTFRVVSANTQGKSDSLADFRSTVATVRRETPAFVGWQEVKTATQRNVLRVVMGDDYTHHHTDLAVPISVHADWEVVDTGRRKTHDGRKNASPARWIAWVVARHRVTGEVVVFVNTHFVSGAWNNKPKLYKAWRRQMWTDHWQVLRDHTPRWLRLGRTIVVGDFNRIDVAPWHPDLTWADNRGIDKVALFGFEQTTAAARIGTRSDHDARAVNLTTGEAA